VLKTWEHRPGDRRASNAERRTPDGGAVRQRRHDGRCALFAVARTSAARTEIAGL